MYNIVGLWSHDLHHHQSELVGDVAVPVSARQAVLFWALRSPDARPRLNSVLYKSDYYYHRAAPSYVIEMCVPVAPSTGRCCLRSAARDLMVLRTRTITCGSQSFAVSGSRVWNYLLPTSHSSSTTLGQFQSRLKTTLFRLAYGMWLGAFVTV